MNDPMNPHNGAQTDTVFFGEHPRSMLDGLPTEFGPLRVEVVGGPMDGLKRGANTTILTVGRGENNDLVLAIDPRVSHHHASVSRQDDGFWLDDLASTNGTFLGERQVHRRVAIEPGTIFTVGSTYLEFMPR